MLSHQQLRHVAEHAWVLEENVLSPQQTDAYKTALERQAEHARPIVESTAPAASILHFTETPLHAGVPVPNENGRFTMFYGFTPNWFVNWPGAVVPGYILKTVRNDELRGILGGNSGDAGQYPTI